MDLTVRGADYAAKLEQPALAITDHGNVFGAIEHYRWTTDRGLKPIIGCEMYVVDELTKESPRRHLTVLVKNQKGYENLMRLVTLSYDQMYYKPRVTYENLEENSSGLVVLSGCPSGHIGKAIESGDLALAERYFVRLLDAFDGDFYAEVQHNDRAKIIAPYLIELAERHGVELVATNDAHYVEKQDRPGHDIMLKLKAGEKGEENPTYGSGFHMMSRQEMGEALQAAHPGMSRRQIGRALDVTVEIADKVDFKFEKPERMLPALWGDEARVSAELGHDVEEGMKRLGLAGPRYLERMTEELRVIRQLGYCEYFMLCSDVTTWARNNDILIGPRGSVCGSLVAYSLGITMIDPLRHGTMFERFLHDKKKSFPDIDLDIDSRRRDEVHAYIHKTYGEYAYPIVTFGRWGAGNVANDLSKAYDLPDHEKWSLREAMDEVKRNRVFVAKEEDLDALIFSRLERRHPGFKRVVTRMYSQVRYVGKHPGGVCFVPANHYRWFGLAKAKDERMTTGNFQDVEYCGLLKMDFLGLAAVASVAGAAERVLAKYGEKIDLTQVPLDDPDVIAKFAKAETDGVFQFETRGAREILRAIRPDSFLEVAAATALNRPGVMDNLGAYVKGKGEA